MDIPSFSHYIPKNRAYIPCAALRSEYNEKCSTCCIRRFCSDTRSKNPSHFGILVVPKLNESRIIERISGRLSLIIWNKTMADSLFDNRYRYNYIYPRGRSGETLRALDTVTDDRPVVIKRPAPNDAPPIRAGQEVSIVNEREALSRLAGHPTLTELVGSGQFFVGGIPHQYIVMERAEGIIIADEVVRLAALNERLPELEMLEIIDRLVHLLQAAHDKDIVYNDVDAKHLFWNREHYSLKVIDWGNAVFLEGDEATSQGISRQTDIYQIGELLYFILSGGHRVDVPRDAGHDFKLDFHQDAQNVNHRLQEIVSKAVHPSVRRRYTSLKALNADLARYRTPLEHVRNAIVSRTITRLKNPNLSRSELATLQNQLESAIQQNPAYPVARSTHSDIVDRLRDLAVSADLDAVKIYMGNGNWSRAAELLNDMRERTGSKTSGIVHLLLDWCMLLIDTQLDTIPPAITESTTLLFEYKPDKAANALMVDRREAESTRAVQWQMAERISSHFSDILLLRPNVSRLDNAVRQLGAEGIPVDDLTTILRDIGRILDQTEEMEKPSATQLRDIYGEVVESISSLNSKLQTLSLQHEFSERRLPLNALTRALNAAMALADNMHVIGKQAANNPRDALTALDASRAIDPPNPVWDQIEDFLSHLYEILQTSQTFVPAVDGSDLSNWLQEKHDELAPFSEHLFDEMLSEMLENIQAAQAAWQSYRDVIVAGNKIEALDLLTAAAKSVSTISPTLSSWFDQLHSVVKGADYVERHSVPGHLGRTLADGWAAFDNGQLADSERLGQQAMEIARSDNEQAIADRLYRLSHVLREWVERNGVESESRTQKALLDVEHLYTEQEDQAIGDFASQMPSTDTYLKAMGQGLVQAFGNSNTASLRILFAQYVLCGVLDAHDGIIEDARFWRAAADRALPESEDRQPAMRKLDEFIERRVALLDAQNLLDSVNDKQSLDKIDDLVGQLEDNPQARLLAPGAHSLRTLEAAVQDWASAEFRAAGSKIEQVLRAITETESNANISLTRYRDWMMQLQTALADLSVKRRGLLQDIDRQLDEPQATIRDTIHIQAKMTDDLLGQEHAQSMLSWRDTYEQFLDIYTSRMRRSQKLEDMNELFKALFIERNPAYALFRHWYRLVESSPEETKTEAESLLGVDDDAPLEVVAEAEPAGADHPVTTVKGKRAGMSRLLFNMAAVIGLILVIGGLISLAADGNFETILADIAVNPTATALPTKTTLPATIVAQEAIDAAAVDSDTVQSDDENLDAASAPAVSEPKDAGDSDDTTEGQQDLVPAETDMPEATDFPEPTATDLPTATPLPTHTPPPTLTPTPALPPEGLRGAQNLLDLYSNSLAAPFWNEERFSSQEGTWRLGVASQTDGETTFNFPPPDLLDSRYGNEAPRRISRIETDLTLRSFNPAVVSGEDVYFGILFQSTSGSENAGIQVQAIGPNVINLALYSNNEADFISQRSVNAVIARLRLDRDPLTGVVFAYFNDSQIGAGIPFVAPDAEVVPVIFVKDGGVVVGVSSWSITLQ